MRVESDVVGNATRTAPVIGLFDAILPERGRQFFSSIAMALPEAANSLPYFLARFRRELFSPELFDQYGVYFPPHIRMSVNKRQAEFIAGRICARSILDTYGHADHVVTVGTHREPVWPEGFIGSITHSNHYAAAIACPARGVLGIGIDIETTITDDAREAMIELVVSAEELSYLRASTGAVSFDQLLTLVFSAKESFFKAAFPQVKAYFDFDAVKVFAIDPTRQLVRFRCEQQLCAGLQQAQEHEAHFNFIGDSSVLTAVVLKHRVP